MFRNDIDQNREMPRLGIGSFAFRYAIGFGDFKPPKPMTVLDFLSEAHRLGFGGIQLCENLAYSDFNEDKLLAIKEKALELGLFIELGMRDLTLENISRHLEIAELLSSQFLRVVLGTKGPCLEDDKAEVLRARLVKTLRGVLPRCREQNVVIGIENHFDLPTEDLVKIVEEINDEHVGLIFDTTNCLGFIERPEETLQTLQPHLVSIHLKDFNVRKVEAGYLISGTSLGEGWLRVEDILKSAVISNSILSLIIEMTIRRKEQQTIKEILSWEKRAIEKSVSFLRETLSRIKCESI